MKNKATAMLGSVLVEGGMMKDFSITKSQNCYRVLLDMYKVNGITSSPAWKAYFTLCTLKLARVGKTIG